ncbi:MAG: PEP-CTERM sorting domain-containing protein [Akkermansia sp.]|nr:PEP-CTERM sorting domain-containing protein [Akkermansia sp.]
MNGRFFTIVRSVATLGLSLGTLASALEVDTDSNEIFDLYYFSSGEVGNLGSYNTAVGYLKEGSTYYWSDDMQQAMVNAVNTWTSAIANEYDLEKHGRKLRIGFFLDDGTGELMDSSMAGYASFTPVTSYYQEEYGSQANYYSVVEWAWRDNNITSGYSPAPGETAYNWDYHLLPSGAKNVDVAIVLNPVVTELTNNVRVESARSLTEMQNVATHEIGHAMGVNSSLYWPENYIGFVTTWDSLLTLDGQRIVTEEFDQYGNKIVLYNTFSDLHAAAWEPIPENPEDYTWTEIQYDPNRKLSIEGEEGKVGVHVSSLAVGGDSLEHLSYNEQVGNVLGPGGTANASFSETDLLALELLGWDIRREANVEPGSQYTPEPTTTTLSLLALAGLAARRRRR